MSTKRIYSILIPTITFIFGIFAQILIERWVSFKDPVVFSFVLIMICLIITILMLELNDKKIDSLNQGISEIKLSLGLKVEYIEDTDQHNSYEKSTEIIEGAKDSILVVSPWNPFKDYQQKILNTKLKDSRADYYRALKSAILAHQDDQQVFHNRIIQVRKEHLNTRLEFEIDPIYLDYVKQAANIQQQHPRSCRIRKTSTSIEIHFTIVDQRYIIMPILSHFEGDKQIRHGALFFDDTQGDLTKVLKSIYEILNTRSQPIEPHQLIP